MATIFISHSSRDDALASQLEAWLRGNGFTDLFIDHSSISGGAAWADALRANAGSARVVLCLVTPHWLASTECTSEFKAAWYMGKRIIPVFLLGDEAALNDTQRSELGRVRAEAQGLDLTVFIAPEGLDFDRDEAVAEVLGRGLREAGALAAVGLDPHAFEIDRRERPSPFPGLTSFGDEDADAALFFGRSREIAETLEDLRKMRAGADRRPFVILGASGSGKSSLLKAGIIPRLRREGPAWLPLRAFRPGADPLLNFAEAITKTLADFGEREAHGGLKRTLLDAWQGCERNGAGDLTADGQAALIAALETHASRLRTHANRPGATILISVDQAEELTRSDGDSGQALADYLRAAMDAASPLRLAFTIRTDSFPELQAHPRFQGLEARGYDLRTLPVFRFDDVAEHPAARYGVEVDPALTDALMEDAPGKDALPLLAFALQRLWDQFHVSGKLTHADYISMGGLSGLIEDAAERALCGIDPEQRDAALPAGGAKAHQVELGQRVFVPALADVNDESAAIRRVAAWADFDPPAQELLERFDRWRLVVRKEGDGDGATVEVAHEALFREWPRLRDWLEPERARLEALRRRIEITHDEWAQCVTLTDQSALLAMEPEEPKTGCAPLSDAGFGTGSYPAINVSWHDAQGYLRWLNAMISGDPDAGPYRLLSEAEWEYAARAGTQTAYSWGDDVGDICTYANVANPDTKLKYGFQWDGVDCPGNYLETSPVGAFEPNGFGLYDMHGNVWEWVEDCYEDSYSVAPTDGSARVVSDCSRRVLRGGSWSSYPQFLRSANRYRNNPTVRNINFGFRVARTLSPPTP